MIIYNKYLNNEDFTWYDSSNILFSKCYDNDVSENKTVKIVFKQGRTYLYKDVSTDDYIAFKTDSSNGSAFNKYIKKYQGVRIADTDMNKLQQLQEDFKKDENEINDEKLSDIQYHIDICSKTGLVQLKLNDKVLYTVEEGKASVFSILKAMNIKYSWQEVDEITKQSDEFKDEIKLN